MGSNIKKYMVLLDGEQLTVYHSKKAALTEARELIKNYPNVKITVQELTVTDEITVH